jgi:hypothetical protein
MSLRITAVLVLLAIAVGVVVYINPFKKEEKRAEDSPWFYQVSMDDITFIGVKHQDKYQSFVRTEYDTWAFQDPAGIPPFHDRWGGMTLLLSGPQTRRDLTVAAPTIDDPTRYGLDEPQTIVDVKLTGNRHIQFRLGDTTTDGEHHYGEVVGFKQLYIISSSWGDVLARLATEPPYPKWYVKRTTREIDELNIYQGNPAKEETALLQFKHKEEDGSWTVQSHPKDKDPIPVDTERWAEIEPLVVGPPSISVAMPLVEDQDYTSWGITDDSRAVEIRFAGTTQRGTRYIDGILLRLGNKSPDGRGYYAKSESNYVREPVLLLDAEWTEKILGLFDNVPYAKNVEAQNSGQTN